MWKQKSTQTVSSFLFTKYWVNQLQTSKLTILFLLELLIITKKQKENKKVNHFCTKSSTHKMIVSKLNERPTIIGLTKKEYWCFKKQKKKLSHFSNCLSLNRSIALNHITNIICKKDKGRVLTSLHGGWRFIEKSCQPMVEGALLGYFQCHHITCLRHQLCCPGNITYLSNIFL